MVRARGIRRDSCATGLGRILGGCAVLMAMVAALNAADGDPEAYRSYDVYAPRIDRFQVTSAQSHDSTIAWFRDRWIVLYDGGTERPGQRISQCSSRDLETWSDPIEVYTTPAGSVEPTEPAPDAKQWQPGLVEVGDELWSFWVQTRGKAGPDAQTGLFWSRLRDPDGRWTHRRIFGPGLNGEQDWVQGDDLREAMFVGNGGIVASNGRVVVPVTLRRWEAGVDHELQYDMVIYSDDDGRTWHRSQAIASPDGVARAWEATIWEPAGGTDGELWLISRNGFKDRRMSEAQHYARSRDFGATWSVPKRPLPMELAMSRSYVTTYGPRAILVQHDHYDDRAQHWHHRQNLALMFTRGPGVGFVAGTLLSARGEYVDYPQMAIRGGLGAIVYTHQNRSKKWNVDARSQWVARIDPLPDPEVHYLFPRFAHGHVEHRLDAKAETLVFTGDRGSAGIDVDANDPTEDTLQLRIRFRIDEDAGQPLTIMTLGQPEARVVFHRGVLTLRGEEGTSTIGPVGSDWVRLDLVSGGGLLRARLAGGDWVEQAHAPVFRWPYLGRATYADAPRRNDGLFSVDVAALRSRVLTDTDWED